MTPPTTSTQQQDRLALVSSLYGPGTILAWYLTTAALSFSWILHPHKRRSGSLDLNLSAVLTLPAVAAGHLIAQASALLKHMSTSSESFDEGNLLYLQRIAAIEAPFGVVEAFMPISVILCLVAIWNKCIRRGVAVAAFGLFCFASECYIHFSDFKHLDLRYQPGRWTAGLPAFSRLFIADFTSLIVAGVTLCSLCSFILPLVAIVLSERSSTSTVRNALQTTNNNAQIDSGLKLITLGSMLLFLSVTFVLSLMPIFWFSTDGCHLGHATDPVQTMQVSFFSRASSNFAPRTPYSIIDLDQAVTAAAGTSVLAFSTFEIIKARLHHNMPTPGPVTAPNFGTAVRAQV
ncbi:hypothetical protein GJ744_005614 [Endocarpon pusillum]|uniref:Uncharacterized protein n=1 Tax=Endocarpon pusillum TaxID=364733 RepID=A0A8H7A8I0_9EURO|nr:hypothetical protein GJ744_005614 [Endocarpon pusillum]